jgi:hypothetical protein
VKKPIVAGALVAAAFAAGIIYFAHDPADQSAATMRLAESKASGAESAPPAAAAPQSTASGNTLVSSPAPSDPRLAALSISPDNGLIEFVRAPDGKVIAEIDKDPSSPGFNKPSREYLYSGDKRVGVTAYRYMGDHVEVSRTTVFYKPDGSVDQLAASTDIRR